METTLTAKEKKIVEHTFFNQLKKLVKKNGDHLYGINVSSKINAKNEIIGAALIDHSTGDWKEHHYFIDVTKLKEAVKNQSSFILQSDI